MSAIRRNGHVGAGKPRRPVRKIGGIGPVGVDQATKQKPNQEADLKLPNTRTPDQARQTDLMTSRSAADQARILQVFRVLIAHLWLGARPRLIEV